MLLHLVFVVVLLFTVQATNQFSPQSSDFLYGETPVTRNPKMYYMSAVTNVTNRYAITLITSRIKNPSVVSKEAIFSIVLPEKAFISSFVMEINNKSYKAFVKEKTEAQKIYDTALEKGQGAAQVKVSTRNKRFIVSVNLEPEEKAAFFLTYEELLERSRNQYELLLNVHPGEPVKKLHLEMNIYDSQNIKFVNPPRLRRGTKINSKTYETDAKVSQEETSASITFDPDEYEQKRIAKRMETLEEKGISRQFFVTYDIEKRPEGGVIIQSKSYFAHYLAVPPKLTTFFKYIILILDTSASMQGDKLIQMKFAMNNILNGLKPGDKINLVEFSSFVKVWDIAKGAVTYEEGDDDFLADYEDEDERIGKNVLPPAFEVNEKTIEKAKSIFDLLQAYGGTDIDLALQTGLKLYANNFHKDDGHQALILFLTDGDVTNGELDYDRIIKNVTNLNNHHIPIYALSLGNSPNREFLEKLALKNYGKSDHIYEDTDISAQLQTFFSKISDTILKDVIFNYGPGIDDLTKDRFDNLNKDSELIVSGKKSEHMDFKLSPPEVTGLTVFGKLKVKPVVENLESDNMKRLWAYLRIKQLLDQRKISEDKTQVTRKALRLALKYSFVTELTSLVVVKPNSSDKVVDLEDAIEGASGQPPGAGGHSVSAAIVPSKPGAGNIHPFSFQYNSAYNGEYNYSQPVNVTSAITDLDVLTQKLPWMKNVLYSNGTVTTPNGPIQIELNFLHFQSVACVTEAKKNGLCVQLLKCEPLFYKLKTLNDFLKHSCTRDNTFTGICCDTQIVSIYG